MKTFSLLIVFFLLFSASPGVSFAKIWINEFSSSDSEDWVELYNDSENTVSLDGLRLRDGSSTNKIDLSGDIEAKGFAYFEWGNKLTNSGDTIKLVSVNDENNAADQVVYGESGDILAPESGQTAGRTSNGGTVWGLFSGDTKGTTNSDAQAAPTPTTELENTPTPAKQPTPTKVPTPKKTPTPMKSPKAISGVVSGEDEEDTTVATRKTSPTVTKALMISGVPTSILGISSKKITPQPKPSDSSEEKVMVKSAVAPPYFIIASGTIFCAACGILVFLKRRNKYHES